MNSDSGAIYSCRLSSPPSVPPDFFFSFFFVGRRDGRKAQGYLWSNHYTISSPQRPCCIHLSVGSPLSRSISPCHSPPLSPTRSLLLSFPIYLSSNLRLLCFSLYSVPHSVGCDRCCVLVGGESEILYYWARRQRGGLNRKTSPAKWGLV